MWQIVGVCSFGLRSGTVRKIALNRIQTYHGCARGKRQILINEQSQRSCVLLQNTSRPYSQASVGDSTKQSEEHSHKHQKDEKKEEFRKRRKQLIWSFVNFVTWLPAYLWFERHVGSVAIVTGQSMSPTLNPIVGDRDYVFLNRFASERFWYKIGDVVMLISPNDPNSIICKRILALPGDIVSVNDPSQKDNDQNEKKIRIRIPPSHVWVEGDQSVLDAEASLAGQKTIRTSSRDSRQFGPVSIGLITARVDMILWPSNRFGFLPDRPNFDVAKMRSIHEAREERMKRQYSNHRTGQTHPDDSILSPYTISEWEWSTDPRGSKGIEKHNRNWRDEDIFSPPSQNDKARDEDVSPSQAEERKRARQERREASQKAAQIVWNRLSRGGRLGDDAISVEED